MQWCNNVPRGGAEEEEKESKRGGDDGMIKQDVSSCRSTGINWGEAAINSQRKAQGRADWRTTRRQSSCTGPYKAHVRWRQSSTTGAVIEVGQQWYAIAPVTGGYWQSQETKQVCNVVTTTELDNKRYIIISITVNIRYQEGNKKYYII